MSAPALAVRDVAKSYGRRAVLRGISFEVHRGEIVGIVGENGTGKSTLLRILAGLLRADAGHVLCAGRLGYCDQEPQLFPNLTVAEHFAYFACAYGLTGNREWLAMREELLGTFHFARDLHSRAAQLSGGTRQKLHLSLALLHRPDVLVMDEPYLAFDWDTYLRFWAHAEAARGAGTAIVIVSHLAHDRERFTRILHLSDGELRCA
jgi:ABC-type multidrug transport system ATPase subunit